MPIGNKQKALVHVAKRKLGLSEMEYRSVLRRAGVASSKALDKKGLDIVMRHFEKLGFTPLKKTRYRGKGLPQEKARMAAKIFAICADLGLSNNYADGIARRMFSVDRVEWCNPGQLYKIVQALSVQQKRNKGAVYKGGR